MTAAQLNSFLATTVKPAEGCSTRVRCGATATVERLLVGRLSARFHALVSPTGEIWNTVFAQLDAFNSLRDMSLAA